MIDAAVLDAMVEAGCTAEQIVAAVKADMARDEARREAKRAGNADRQKRFRNKGKTTAKRAVTLRNDSNALRCVTAPLSSPPNDIYSNPPHHTPPVTRPEGVSEQVWGDFADHRKRLKAPISPTVIDGFRREAGKAGVTLERAIAECVTQGWRGFRADWFKPDRGPDTAPGGFLASKLAKAQAP